MPSYEFVDSKMQFLESKLRIAKQLGYSHVSECYKKLYNGGSGFLLTEIARLFVVHRHTVREALKLLGAYKKQSHGGSRAHPGFDNVRIILRSRKSAVELAEIFNTSPLIIADVRKGKSWACVEGTANDYYMQHRNEKLKIANRLGYSRVVDGMRGEYLKLGSLRRVAEIFDVTPEAVRYRLVKEGVQIKKRGGYNR